MRVEQKTVVLAPRERVWELVSDPRRYAEFMEGLAVADVLSESATGPGARWAVRLVVGAAALGGTVEVVEHEPPGDLAWNAVTGISLRGRWRLRERTPGRTEVVFRLAYQAPGGLGGLLADRVAAPVVRRRMRHSLRTLKTLVET
ncbi:MAG: cyclase/dehydrase [Frankiales bacterium]|nr:cyclase/dehydrase [Frankiales bacterium]